MSPTSPNPERLRPGTPAEVAALLTALAVAVAMVLVLAAPTAERASTSGAAFSAEAARAHLEVLAAEPRPFGSPAHQRVRQHLVAELGRLGMEVEGTVPRLSSATDGLPDAEVTTAAWTQNVVARVEGREGRGTVVLLAHYDSVRNSPGASDNGYGVAGVVETTRALLAAGPARNDLVVVLSDAEETGLLGARALIASQRLDPATTVVINQEARGSAGPTQLVRAHGDIGTVRAAGGPRALGGSEIASLFANATEFDVLAPAGFRVLELANSAGSARYDSGADDLTGVSGTSLQQRGDLVLQTARSLLAEDLTRPWQAEEVTWFTVAGTLVVPPPGAVGGVLVLTVVTLLVAAGLGLRRGPANGHRPHRTGVVVRSVVVKSGIVTSLLAGLAVAVAAALSALAVTGWWRLLVAVRPAYGSFLFGDTPRPFWHQVSMLVLAALVTTLTHLSVSRRWGPAVMVNGHLVVTAVAAASSVLVLPSAADLFVVPTSVGSILVLVGTWLHRPLLPGPWLAAYVTAVLIMWIPTADIGASGLAQAWLPAISTSMVSWPVLCLTRAALPRAPVVLVLTLCGSVLASAVLGLATDRITPRHPRHSSLALLQHAGAPAGTWVSNADDAWATSFATGALARSGPTPTGLPPDPVLGLHAPVRTGPGPAVDRPPPRLTRHGQGSSASPRSAEVSLVPAGSDRIALHLDGSARITAVDGHPLAGTATPRPEQFVHLITSPDPSTRHRVTISIQDEGPVTLHALGLRTGFDGVPGYRPPPPDTTWAPGVLNHVTAVEATLVL